MIFDRVSNLGKYIPKSLKDDVLTYVNSINNENEDEYVKLRDEDVYAKVMTYMTKPEHECEIEAHDKYCDIQISLKNAEGISIFDRSSLRIKQVDEKNDFITFENNREPLLRVSNTEGYFSLIHTWEAHRPQECIDKENPIVKKVVIKIREEFFDE